MRNAFSVPMRWTPALLMDFARHPAWSLTTLSRGAPCMRNMEGFVDAQGGRPSFQSILALFARAVHEWDFVERLRARWKGKLIIKGVLNPEDAARMAATGADAVVISNHGGRQLSSVTSTIEALPAIRQAVGSAFPLSSIAGYAAVKALPRLWRWGRTSCSPAGPSCSHRQRSAPIAARRR